VVALGECRLWQEVKHHPERALDRCLQPYRSVDTRAGMWPRVAYYQPHERCTFWAKINQKKWAHLVL
jgi:hypothetical protein